MLEVQPFEGVIYNRSKVNEATVVAPPYDVISSDKQEELYIRDKKNVVRLILGRNYDEDNPANNRYTRARDYYNDWLENGTLTKLSEEAIYVYEQVYYIGQKKMSRLGFMAAVKLEDFEKGVILPHEKTLPKAQTDRLMLLRACKVNFSPIFALYSDKEMATDLLLEASHKESMFDLSDDDDVEHKLSRIVDQKAIKQLQELMRDKVLYIADGHHRYKTALQYRDEMRKQNGGAAGPWDYVMIMLVNSYCEGLTVLPTHRLVRGISEQKRKELVELLFQYFTVEKVDKDVSGFVAELEKAGSQNKHAFGLYLPRDEKFLLTLSPDIDPGKIFPGKAKSLQELDVTILHDLIFNEIMEMPANVMEVGSQVKFMVDVEEIVDKVEEGEFQMAFLLNRTRVEQVQEVANEGEIMPQKSTYFYPKLLSGLVMRPLIS